ncbi:M20/M25/M40 family metallo-hydrolase [Leptolyngbya sp. 7M]|uniref:M20/M25/M40 family metallo-hydrolase n=1 Tax=Leptolyngbya sp. 7M TaxID=2812896 RepID=UPI001B8A8E65|nr:M28 family metallopeptidase [Leptolyngbya sp. 7M]QYO66918.1 M28 family metallopeptidase [Leptolyngbya sp. 7M]
MFLKFISVSLLLSIGVVSEARSQRPDPVITEMLKEVSSARIEADIKKLESFGTRNTLSAQDDPKRGIGAARDWIYEEFRRISEACAGCLTVEKQSFTQPVAQRIPQPTVITNVFATLKGTTDPERFYVVSGHYDSMCTSPTDAECDAPGANDDASGTAAVIEMARVMSKRKFDASIIFMAVAGEEQGLLGARYFATQAAERKMNIEAMFTNDIVGGVTTKKNSPDRNKVRVFAEGVPSNETEQQAATRRSVGGENDSPARQLARYIFETAEMYSPDFGVMMIYRRDRYGRGGDHIPFLENGFAAVRFTEPNEDYDHQHQNVRTVDGKFYGDTSEYVDFDYVARVTRINAASLARLALAPAKPRNVGIVTARLGNDTELKWDASQDADIAGYEIVWRDTTAATWTNSRFIGNVTSYVMKDMSKDNVFFGVRAVDKSGNKSPVVYPRPTR